MCSKIMQDNLSYIFIKSSHNFEGRNNKMDSEYYIKSFSNSQEKISDLIDQIILCNNSKTINRLLIELIAEAKLHMFEKTNCCSEGGCAVLSCVKGIKIEKAGLQLVEKCLHEGRRTKEIQKIVISWFRDNFWMIEAECLNCINLGFSAFEQEELHTIHMTRIKKFQNSGV